MIKNVTSIFTNRVESWKIKVDLVFPVAGAEIMRKGLFPQKQEAIPHPQVRTPDGWSGSDTQRIPQTLKNLFSVPKKKRENFLELTYAHRNAKLSSSIFVISGKKTVLFRHHCHFAGPIQRKKENFYVSLGELKCRTTKGRVKPK